ncbi:VOC family protein [Streptomyces hirsutus]|uniref:VOC family protein n=1 Tax=Streptomyces hirsutus TaxID=35620 RepID=A0ABZ1GLF4_9ACTN|nr:VOC family protein [Streptomyces hirsutus]WSD07006.1 VOC family protein [Streptomyces hirsutus]WTD19581.1 VOC family protein [Streptomyces hirsutus]WTD75516.1 VOC family protein [Streptomyces sp. NBC_01635]
MPVAKVGAVVLDCADPRALAGFYAGLVGGTIKDEGDWVDLRVPGGPVLAFQEAPGHVPPRWPAPDHSQQFHLDLTVEDLDAAEKEVLALGAKPLEAEDRSRSFRVYADPAGHPFCLCAC